jgi:hypothetical protein
MNEEKQTKKQKDNNDKKNYTRRLPNIELFQSLSKDGRYQIVKRVETFVIPVNYIKKVMGEASDSVQATGAKSE